MQSTAQEVKRDTIGTIISQDLNAAAIRLTDLVEELYQRLAPVSMPTDLPISEDKVKPIYPPLFDSLHSSTVRLLDAMDKIEEILKRLEV